MNATVIKDGIDRIDTGLPDHPDLGRVLARGRRLRRGRQAGLGVGLAALVAAVALPVGLLANGDDGPVLAPDPATASSSVPGREFGPGFGDAMTATVTALLPEAQRIADSQRDHYEKNGACCTTPAVNDPVDYAHVFSWSQAFDMPSGAQLFVDSMQYPAQLVSLDHQCPEASPSYPEQTCDVSKTADGRTLVVILGEQFDNTPQWGLSIRVLAAAPGTHGMLATTSVSVTGAEDAATWAVARETLPDVDTLTQLALDPNLVIPEPETIPGFKVGNLSYPALP
ncbi:MAG: hypothetical protein ABIO16_18575 [Nocardioides sp.]